MKDCGAWTVGDSIPTLQNEYEPVIEEEEERANKRARRDVEDNRGGLSFASNADGIRTPSDNDVLCGRGPRTFDHNKETAWRRLIRENKIPYQLAKRNKRAIAVRILQGVKETRGRFLEKAKNGLWYEIDEKRACEKTMQALRDDSMDAKKHVRTMAFHRRMAAEFPAIAPLPPSHSNVSSPQLLPAALQSLYDVGAQQRPQPPTVIPAIGTPQSDDNGLSHGHSEGQGHGAGTAPGVYLSHTPDSFLPCGGMEAGAPTHRRELSATERLLAGGAAQCDPGGATTPDSGFKSLGLDSFHQGPFRLQCPPESSFPNGNERANPLTAPMPTPDRGRECRDEESLRLGERSGNVRGVSPSLGEPSEAAAWEGDQFMLATLTRDLPGLATRLSELEVGYQNLLNEDRSKSEAILSLSNEYLQLGHVCEKLETESSAMQEEIKKLLMDNSFLKDQLENLERSSNVMACLTPTA